MSPPCDEGAQAQARLVGAAVRPALPVAERWRRSRTLWPSDWARRSGAADHGSRSRRGGPGGLRAGSLRHGEPQRPAGGGGRRSMAAGRNPAAYSATVGYDTLYVAVPISDGTQSPGRGPGRGAPGPSGAASRETATAIAVGGLAGHPSGVIAALAWRAPSPIRSTISPLLRSAWPGESWISGSVAPLGTRSAGWPSAFDSMADRLRATIKTISAERNTLASVLSTMADGIVIVDRRAGWYLANRAAASLLQTPMSSAGGQDLRGGAARPRAEPRHAALPGAGDRSRAGPRRWGRPAGCCASSPSPLRGERPGPLALLQDLTDVRRAETVRRDFIANVSHELRTPLATLKALVETLEEGAIDEPEVARDFLSKVHGEVDGLAQLVSELLELSRIESGQAALRLEALDPVDLAGRQASGPAGRPGRAGRAWHCRWRCPDELPRVTGRRPADAAGAGEPDPQRHQVHALRGRSWSVRGRDRARGGLLGVGHRRGHPARGPAPDLRALLQGGPLPLRRRHRAWAWPSPSTWSRPTAAASGWRAPRDGGHLLLHPSGGRRWREATDGGRIRELLHPSPPSPTLTGGTSRTAACPLLPGRRRRSPRRAPGPSSSASSSAARPAGRAPPRSACGPVIRTGLVSPSWISTVSMAAAEREWMFMWPVSKAMRLRPFAMSRASASRMVPASSVMGWPSLRWFRMAWRVSETITRCWPDRIEPVQQLQRLLWAMKSPISSWFDPVDGHPHVVEQRGQHHHDLGVVVRHLVVLDHVRGQAAADQHPQSRRAMLTTICMWMGPWSLIPSRSTALMFWQRQMRVQVLVGVDPAPAPAGAPGCAWRGGGSSPSGGGARFPTGADPRLGRRGEALHLLDRRAAESWAALCITSPLRSPAGFGNGHDVWQARCPAAMVSAGRSMNPNRLPTPRLTAAITGAAGRISA